VQSNRVCERERERAREGEREGEGGRERTLKTVKWREWHGNNMGDTLS
jgi:hypothetical protein